MPFCNFVQTYKMQRLLLFLLSSFFLTVSCNKSTEHSFLDKKQMANLLTEVHLIDGYLNSLPIDSTRKVIEGLYEEVFVKFKIDSTDFKRNLTHYLSNPVEAKQIYDVVNKNLTAYDREFRIKDSIHIAFVSDSMRIAQNYLKLKQENEELILNVKKDSIPFDYKMNAEMMMRKTGLTILQIYGVTIPVASETMESVDSVTDEVVTDSVDTVESKPTPIKLKPERRPATPGRRLQPMQIQE